MDNPIADPATAGTAGTVAEPAPAPTTTAEPAPIPTTTEPASVPETKKKENELKDKEPDAGLAGVAERVLSLDSSVRDRILYPDANNFCLQLSRSLYNVNKISISGALIPNPLHSSNSSSFTHDPLMVYIKLKNSRFGEITDSLSASDEASGHCWFGQFFIEQDNSSKYVFVNPTRDSVFQKVKIDVISDLNVELYYFNVGAGIFQRFPTNSGEVAIKLLCTCSLDKRFSRDRIPGRLKDNVDPDRERPNVEELADDFAKMRESHVLVDRNQSILPYENMGSAGAGPIFLPSAVILIASIMLMTFPESALL